MGSERQNGKMAAIVRTGDDPQLTYHGRLATPMIYDVIGVTRFLENRFPPQFLFQPLFLLGHVSAKHNARVRETRVYLNTSACEMVGSPVVLQAGDRGHQDSEFGTSNFFLLALGCSPKSVGPPTVGPVAHYFPSRASLCQGYRSRLGMPTWD